MKLTGQKLKEKRESARLTISEVSLATKINPKVLTAMECGDQEHLPAKTFLRGFVRAYAGFLKMNVAEVLELFTQELGEAQKETLATPVSPADVPAKKEASAKVDVDGEGSGTFRMFIIGGILILIVLIIGVRSVVQKYERERNVDAANDLSKATPLPLDERKADEKSDDGLAPAAAATSAAPDSDASTPTPTPAALAGNPEPAAVKPTPSTPPPPAAAPPAPVQAQAPAPPAVTPPVEAPKPKAAEPKPEEAKAESKPASKGKRHEIILEALDKVEVSYKLNGQNKKIPMAPGQVHTIFTEETISFDVSDGGALNITDNGRDKGPAGDLGHRKQISIP